MLSDEEKKAIERIEDVFYQDLGKGINKFQKITLYEDSITDIRTILNLIEKQTKEIEELKETLKCTQNSWFEDTQKIEEMKKQIDLDNECEIALNNKIMDLEKEIEELKEKNKPQSDCEEPIERTEEMVNMKWVNHNYISKDKIKAKIEELDEEIKVKREIARKPMDRVSGRLLSDNIVELEKTKKVLQSLLEKE